MKLKNIFLTLGLAALLGSANAQSDSSMMLDDLTAGPDYVTSTFKGTRLINFHTVETPGKRSLEFRVSHRFGEISTGAKNFYGLDGPASIWLGFDYSYNGRLSCGIGRVSTGKLLTSNLKYKLAKQTLGNLKMPVTITLLAGMNYTTATPSWGDAQYKYATSRMSYVYQLMFARKFNDAISLQISPTMLHYNLVQAITDKNDIFAINALGRYKFSRSTAVTFEYSYKFNDYSTKASQYVNSAGIGFDVETGGHVFQMFLTNAFGIAETQTIPYSVDKISKGQIMIGFNISRPFDL